MVVNVDWTVADCIGQVECLAHVRNGRLSRIPKVEGESVIADGESVEAFDPSSKLSELNECPEILYYVDFEKLSVGNYLANRFSSL